MNITRQIDRILPERLHNLASGAKFEYRKVTWRFRPLPDFIILGAQKSGTSSMHEYLLQHPQLYSSPYKKEIHFFDSNARDKKTNNFEKGEKWYRAHFPSLWERGRNSRTFDNTPIYLFHPLVPERIFKMIPDVKLIALLRNPTERAISHYFMRRRKNAEPLAMMDAFLQEETRLEQVIMEQYYGNEIFINKSYKSRGRYAEQLERYLKYFSPGQILLLGSEDFFNDPQKSLRRVFDFVCVDSDFKVPNLTPRNVGKVKSDVPPEVRAYLNEYFKPFNQALYELTSINFGW